MKVVSQQDPGRPVNGAAPAASALPPPVSPSRRSLRALKRRYLGWQAAVVDRFKQWFFDDGCWYMSSAFAHAFLLFSLAMITFSLPRMAILPEDQSPKFDAPVTPPAAPVPEIDRFEVGNAPLDPTELNTETLMQTKPLPIGGQTAKYFDDSPEFEDAGGGTVADREAPLMGGLGGPSLKDLPGPAGRGGVGVGKGTGNNAGFGGAGTGFGQRGKGHREAMLGSGGGTKASERAVAAALNWLYRHQSPRGNWSLDVRRQCKGIPCSGPGMVKSDAGATGLALLPFLAAGQTHKSKGPYQACISKGIAWLLKHQTPEGDLSAKCFQPMYAHGIATLCLCEAYGMTKDPMVGAAAARGVQFIERAQNESTGGWRYEPQDPLGDTSVFGWQMMALKSAQLAGLAVSSTVIENAQKWLHQVAKGASLGLFCYQPYREVTPSMTAVGMLCSQYLGVGRNDPPMVEGMHFLLSNLPDNTLLRDTYYWYYATLAMHNLGGGEWDAWNRKMRRVLIESQIKGGCAEGSWDPVKPTLDSWGEKGGRLMMTSFNAMTLEVYYRYLPLFNTDSTVPGLPPRDADHPRMKHSHR